MAMGKRKRNRQPATWVTTTDLPTAAGHPLYLRLNQLLREYGFDDFVEGQCAGFFAETMSRPGLPPVPEFLIAWHRDRRSSGRWSSPASLLH